MRGQERELSAQELAWWIEDDIELDEAEKRRLIESLVVELRRAGLN